jgi:transcriptional regulator with XRE-family HTH domain
MYAEISNQTVGQSICQYRRHKGFKALEIARFLKISTQAYTKYERGETAITLNFLNAVARFLNVNPLHFITNGPESVVENIHNSNVAIQTNSSFQACDRELLHHFQSQLVAKDAQIEKLLQHISKL